jgi:NTP pyrophosphatase (non-canonical NTP hydrolase)
MLSGDDLELFGYYDMFDNEQNNPTDMYSKWVEGKIVTEGQARLIENVLGLVGEAGEVAEKIKKQIRDNTKVSQDDIIKELGDVLFYTTALANYYNKNLGYVIEVNIKKLDDREDRGVIKGKGDNR